MNSAAKEGKMTRMSRSTFARFGKKNIYMNTETVIPQSQMKKFLRTLQTVFFARTNFYCKTPQVTPKKLQ